MVGAHQVDLRKTGFTSQIRVGSKVLGFTIEGQMENPSSKHANVANAIVTQDYSGQDAGRKRTAVESLASRL